MARKAQNVLVWAVLCPKGKNPGIHLEGPGDYRVYTGNPDYDFHYLSGFEPSSWDYRPQRNGEVWLVCDPSKVVQSSGSNRKRRSNGRGSLRNVKSNPEEDPLASKILHVLKQSPSDLETIIEETGEAPGKVLSTLTVLEMEGKVFQDRGVYHIKGQVQTGKLSPTAKKARRELEKLLKHLIDARAALERAKGKGEEEVKGAIRRYIQEISERAKLLLNPEGLENEPIDPYNIGMRRLEELMETLVQENRKGFRALREELKRMGGGINERLDRINENIGGIFNAMGVSPQGMGREALLEYLWNHGERVKQIWESTGRKVKRPDVVVKTNKGVYILETKHRIEGAKAAQRVVEQLKQGEKLIREGKVGDLKIGKKEPVVKAVYAFVISPTALEVLEGASVLVLYEGKEALAGRKA